MSGRYESRHPLVALVDETIRISGRLGSAFAEARRATGLGQSELMVLNAVVEAERAPTVPQIGRSTGHPRQLIQRAANALVAAGLIETAANPDHKRAALLHPTAKGTALKRQADAQAETIAAALSPDIDLAQVREAARVLGGLRGQIENALRDGGTDVEDRS